MITSGAVCTSTLGSVMNGLPVGGIHLWQVEDFLVARAIITSPVSTVTNGSTLVVTKVPCPGPGLHQSLADKPLDRVPDGIP